MVEFALIFPILITLLFGIITYGYMLGYRQAVSQAAIEAARAAAIKPVGYTGDRSADARGSIEDSLTSFGVDCASTGVDCDVELAVTCGVGGAAQCVSVTVRHAYRDHPILPAFPGLGITLPRTIEYTAVIERS